jgi:hypothetical protein
MLWSMPRSPSEREFGDLIDAAFERLSFLAPLGYAPPRLSVSARECSIVYVCDGRATIAVFDDRGSEPWMQIVPLWMTRADGTTRTFGLNEAFAVLSPQLHDSRPRSWSKNSASIREWIDWYGRGLEDHLDAISRPSDSLLDLIEARRTDQSARS